MQKFKKHVKMQKECQNGKKLMQNYNKKCKNAKIQKTCKSGKVENMQKYKKHAKLIKNMKKVVK